VAARLLLTEDLSLKAAYARTTQYVHLLTNSSVGPAHRLWVPATARVQPQQAQQSAWGGPQPALPRRRFRVQLRNLLQAHAQT
jgi:hypothetical protein